MSAVAPPSTPDEVVRLAGIPEKVALLLESDRWDPARRAAWREQRLADLLAAARATPFWRERVGAGAGLADVPPLDREALRAEIAAIRLPRAGPVIRRRTSGSTGRPVWSERGAEQTGYAAAARLRQLAWFGLAPRAHPQVDLRGAVPPGAPLVERVEPDPPRFVVNPFALDDVTLPTVHEALTAARGVRLIGALPHLLVQFCELYARSPLDPRALGARLAVTGSELSTPDERELAARTFGCPVTDMYGSGEIPMIACECPKGSLHVNEEVVLLEVLRADGSAASPGELGEVVVTPLHNRELPMLRYRVGDVAALLEEPCPCGVSLARLDIAIGKREEMVRRDDGRLVHPRFLRTIYKAALGERLRAFHTVQDGAGSFAVYLDVADPPGKDVRRRIERDVSTMLGQEVSVRLIVDPERARARLPGGKMRTFTYAGPDAVS